MTHRICHGLEEFEEKICLIFRRLDVQVNAKLLIHNDKQPELFRWDSPASVDAKIAELRELR